MDALDIYAGALPTLLGLIVGLSVLWGALALIDRWGRR